MAVSFSKETRLIMFYKIITGLAQVPFEGVPVEEYEGTRRKHNIKLRNIGHITIASVIFWLAVFTLIND